MESARVCVSVVIPTVDRSEAAYQLLRTLEKQSYAPYEILVIEQSHSVPSTLLDYARQNAQRVRLVHLQKRSLPYARNVGIQQAKGDILLFLDDDEVPDADLIQWHVENYREPWVSGVGGRIVGGYDRLCRDGRIGEIDRLSGKVFRNFNAEVRKEVQHLPGGNMSFRREVFQRVGGFDEAYGGAVSEGEETDFCLRVHKAGLRLIFEPRAKVVHQHLSVGGCREVDFKKWIYWHAHNSVLFALRHADRCGFFLFLIRRIIRFGWFSLQKASPVFLLLGLQGLLKGISRYCASL